MGKYPSFAELQMSGTYREFDPDKDYQNGNREVKQDTDDTQESGELTSNEGKKLERLKGALIEGRFERNESIRKNVFSVNDAKNIINGTAEEIFKVLHNLADLGFIEVVAPHTKQQNPFDRKIFKFTKQGLSYKSQPTKK